MARRMSPSQFKNKIRQLQNQHKRAVDKYNQGVRQHNAQVRKQRQDINRAIQNYNQGVRTHNARVRAYQAKIKSELARLNQRSTTTTRHTAFSASVRSLHSAYVRLDTQPVARESDVRAHLVDLSEKETANSLEAMNALLDDDGDEQGLKEDDLRTTEITNELRKFSLDLDNRWRGALFSLNPQNPDAARHFCTSAREIFTQIIEIKAPDKQVFQALPGCETTDRGNPTRRAKIHYFLHLKGVLEDALEDFIVKDIDNILDLFRLFNDGTHGSSGRFGLRKLLALKTRVEDGIVFLANVAT